jgi:FMN-dependent NADH-azoreductase
MKLLHIDSSILGPNSVSRKLSTEIVAKFKAAVPDLSVTYRDLAATPIAHLSGAYLMAAQSMEGKHEAAIQEDLAMSGAALAEFMAADTVVIGVAFYNFTIPSQLKAWVDRILIVGQTFRYGADGRPEGLMGKKRVVLAIARGGFYNEGSPTASFEHAETYLRTALGFIGITNPEIVFADGLAVGPDHRTAGVAAATKQIATLSA